MKHQNWLITGLVFSLLTICVGLFAADSTKIFDFAAYYEALKEKEAVQIQRTLDLQTLVTGLIALSEGRNEKALADLQAAGQSESIKRFVDSQIKGGLDGLVQRCRQGTDRDEPTICSSCSGAGLDMCTKCRGVGKNKDGTGCSICRGLGAKPCDACDRQGVSKQSEAGEPDPAIDALIYKTLYLKNGGVDLFTHE
ncbi:MAG: hypothetical protein ACYSUT_10735 [Planctomycetota bacterium]|jgi:hypothetical protein